MTVVEPSVDAEIWLGDRPHAVPELTVLFSLRISTETFVSKDWYEAYMRK